MGEIYINKDVETRIIKSINHIEPDRVPIWEALESPILYNHFAPGEKDFLKSASLTCEALGIDMTYGCMFPPLPDEEYDTPNVHVSCQTHWSKHPQFSSVNDIINYKPRIVKRTQEFVDRYVESFYQLKEAYAPHTMYVSQGAGFDFLGIAHGTGIGWDVFTTLLYEAPYLLEKIWDERVDYAVMRNSIYAEYQLGPVMQFCEDLAYKGGLLISPEHIRKYFIPRLKRTIQPLKDAGIKLIFHCDGNLMDVLEDLIETGIDGLNPIDPSAGMNIGFIKQKYGDKLILVGNVDGSRILPFGTPKEVREEVASCISKASPGGGHLIQCGCGELMPDVPLKNALAYFDAVREFGKYPIKL